MSNFEALFDYVQEVSGKLLSEGDKHLLTVISNSENFVNGNTSYRKETYAST